jgi:energy-converting hydrogenase Eha subunit A
MAISEELVGFVNESLAKGIPRAQIEDVLLKAGWTVEQSRAALAAFADIEFPVPVPRARPYLSAREAFMYLVLFSTLYLSAYNLGSLVFHFINRAFPDPAAPGFPVVDYIREAIRWDASSLIVAFPVFVYTSLSTSRAIGLDPTKRTSKIRRWLTYSTLFVAAGVLIADFTTLVYNLLGGELTVRFVLKALTVGVLAGTAFGYYLWDLKGEEEEPKR